MNGAAGGEGAARSSAPHAVSDLRRAWPQLDESPESIRGSLRKDGITGVCARDAQAFTNCTRALVTVVH